MAARAEQGWGEGTGVFGLGMEGGSWQKSCVRDGAEGMGSALQPREAGSRGALGVSVWGGVLSALGDQHLFECCEREREASHGWNRCLGKRPQLNFTPV